MNYRLALAQRVARGRAELALEAMAQYVETVNEDAFLRQPSPDLDALRRKLLGTPLAFYRLFRADLESSGDTDLMTRVHLSDACTKLGSIMALIDSKDEARRAYEQAHEIASGLVALYSDDPVARTALSRACHGLGNLLSEIGQTERALRMLEQANDLRDRLAQQGPRDLVRQRDFARTNSDLGVLYRDAGQPIRARTSFQKTLDLLRRRVAEADEDLEAQGELARVNNNLGMLLAFMGQANEALPLLMEARDLGNELKRKAPRSAATWNNWAGRTRTLACWRICSARLTRGLPTPKRP